jgi:hypothetical protein
MFAHRQTAARRPLNGTASHTIRSLTIRLLAGPALLAAASLFVPQAAQAQGIQAEQALLNRVVDFPHGVVTGNSAPGATVDGARALLGRSSASGSVQGHSALDTGDAGDPIDGERALLSRVAVPGARRPSLQ